MAMFVFLTWFSWLCIALIAFCTEATQRPGSRICKYLLNHSFMIPSLIGVGTSTVVAYAISRIIF